MGAGKTFFHVSQNLLFGLENCKDCTLRLPFPLRDVEHQLPTIEIKHQAYNRCTLEEQTQRKSIKPAATEGLHSRQNAVSD
jgi:hypothetical protein